MNQPDLRNKLSVLALACVMLVLLLLGARQFYSYDLGYHLAFGETFFTTGKIVDHTPYIYTLPPLDTPAAERPEPGPGSWYDSEGRYRFPNANWLSQLITYGSWHLGGGVGLNLLQILIVAVLFAMLVTAMYRSRVPLPLISLALLLLGLVISSRLNMRPELFGYLCLIGQYMLLARLAVRSDKPVPPSWLWVSGMTAIQLLCINSHSYFLLGLAITGTVLAEYVLQALKKRFVDKDFPGFRAYRKIVSRLCLTLAGMVLVCFINPWGWRLVLQPFQTVQYLGKYNIGGEKPGQASHPWDYILELRGTISENWPIRVSDYAVMIMLVLVAAAVILQLTAWILELQRKRSAQEGTASQQDTYRTRWAHLLMISGMLFVGLQTRRNVGVASLIIIPSTLICITDICRHFLGDQMARVSRKVLALANTAVLVLSLYGAYQIISGRLYAADVLPTRFGFGLSTTVLPIGASDWLNKYAPDARVWTDFQTSSTLHFFTRPHKEVPVLTNTWTYPPAVMAEDIFYSKAKVPFSQPADKYNIDAVLLRSDWTLPLHRQLGADPDWKIVHVEGVNVLYMRANESYGTLAAEYEIRPDNFDTDAFVVQAISIDPSFKRSVLSVSFTFKEAGELDLAIDVIESGLRYLSPDVAVWRNLLNLYNIREEERRKNKDRRAIGDVKRMKYVLGKILELEPGDREAQELLKIVNQVLAVVNNSPIPQ